MIRITLAVVPQVIQIVFKVKLQYIHLILKMYNGGKAGLELSTLLFK